MTNPILLSRFIAVALFVGAVAVTWDVWWHGAVGRESFWEPPHLLLYLAIVSAIGAALYGWLKTQEKRWRNISLVLLLIPLVAPFDELWHRMFGVEQLTSPFVIWSPPHVAAIGAGIWGFLLFLPLLRKDPDVLAQRFFGGLLFAGTLSAFVLLSQPFLPTGPYHVLGFWGAGVLAAVFTGLLLIGKRWMPGLGGATLITLPFIVLFAMGLHTGEVAPGIIVNPHDHAPGWLLIFSFLIPAAFLDLIQKSPLWIRGMIAGLFWGGVLYGFSSAFFAPEFQYTVGNATIAIFASALGGLVGGIFASLVARKEA